MALGKVSPLHETFIIDHHLNGQIQLTFVIEQNLTCFLTVLVDNQSDKIFNRLTGQFDFCLFADQFGQGRQTKRFHLDFQWAPPAPGGKLLVISNF